MNMAAYAPAALSLGDYQFTFIHWHPLHWRGGCDASAVLDRLSWEVRNICLHWMATGSADGKDQLSSVSAAFFYGAAFFCRAV